MHQPTTHVIVIHFVVSLLCSNYKDLAIQDVLSHEGRNPKIITAILAAPNLKIGKIFWRETVLICRALKADPFTKIESLDIEYNINKPKYKAVVNKALEHDKVLRAVAEYVLPDPSLLVMGYVGEEVEVDGAAASIEVLP